VWNVGTWSSDANGEIQVVAPRGGAYVGAATGTESPVVAMKSSRKGWSEGVML